MPSLASPSRHHLDSVQVLRAIAAIMVVLFHVNLFFVERLSADGEQASGVFLMGFLGVEIFFVISGFIILHVNMGALGQPGSVGTYVYKRLVRLFPPYWIVIVLTFLAFQMDNDPPPYIWDPAVLVKNVVMLSKPQESLFSLIWTLQYELIFYGLFSVFLLHRTLGVAVFAAWAGLCLLRLATGEIPLGLTRLSSAYCLLFFMGMAVAAGHARIPRRAAPALIGAGVGLFVFVIWREAALGIEWPRHIRTILAGLATMLVIAGLVRWETGRTRRIPAALRFLGDASYSIYLVHLLASMVLVTVLGKLGVVEGLPGWVILWLVSGAATVPGLIFHVLLERPVLRALRRRG